ncbi:hypothetical protein DPMN_075614 [Dreissena polymorpha]|uniref:Uncharacterized protein n=1 Tax=Dreissena polymorpha TaxID=45954 RepID=A0A9D4BPL2_DREPO|nr:hypothetical protein DPMN_075614 [Dreissena polymorpha]
MFELGLEIILIQLLTKFEGKVIQQRDSKKYSVIATTDLEFPEHPTINVTSRVLTRFCWPKRPKTGSIFELVQDIIGTNLLTKFHEHPTINVASTVLTRQIFMMHNRRQTIEKKLSSDNHLTDQPTERPT